MKFHKNLHLVALVATMIALNVQATEVSSEQIVGAVSAWAAANGDAFAKPGSVVDADCVSENGTNLYWIVKMSNGGAVIASPDTDLDLVIAVLEKYDDPLPAGHPLPAILRGDMLNRLSIVRKASSISSSGGSGMRPVSALSVSSASAPSVELPEDVKASVKKANAQWEKYSRPKGGISLLGLSLEGGDASPYVRRIVDGFETGGRFTHWNQGSSPVDNKPLYNLYTPNNAVCGCVATAGAAIMQFFGCTNDIGTVNNLCAYNGAPYPCYTLEGKLDWSILPEDGVNSVRRFLAENEEARDLIGRTAFNMGVLVGMGWSDGGSGAVTLNLAEVFKKYGFKAARAVGFDTSNTSTEQYFKTIYAQTWAGAPVIMSIRGTPGGHAVVACGYARDGDGDEFCRVFMGWGGSGDSWYKFPDIGSFNTVNGAVTMIGLDDDAVVPVCGWANVASTDLDVLLDGAEEPVATIPVNADGYFATRISASLSGKGLRLSHAPTAKELEIAPYDSTVLEREEGLSLSELEAALPDEITFWGLNTLTKSSVDVAREKAKEAGKALLMVSGSGGALDTLLMNLLCHIDATTDMSNRFVFVHVKSSDKKNGDGDPSIGVFDPTQGSSDQRWWISNGRLAYENFVDYESGSDELKYTFSLENTEALTNSVAFVLDSGYDTYARRHSGITVSVKALDVEGNVLSGIGGVDIGYGVYTNSWTNGQVVVMSAPAVCTNEIDGIMYECAGWTTNEVESADNVVNGREASISLATSNSVSFAWLWKVKAFRVSSAPSGFVNPEVAWVYPEDRLTVVADKVCQEGNKYAILYDWALVDGFSGKGSDIDLESVNAVQNGNTISFTVRNPISVLAKYQAGRKEMSDPEEYSVNIEINPQELTPLMNKEGSLTAGANTTYDPLASFAAFTSDVVDATGGVWRCTGWVKDGVTKPLSELAELNSSTPANIELVWELQAPALPQPGEISITGIVKSGDSWIITVSGGVKGCWYWLYSSDDISRLSGNGSQWSGTQVTGPIQATEDGDIVFSVTSTEGRMFWRAKVSATENGDQ